MGDDLVKRLRYEQDRLDDEAADRIEQLEREKASWKGAYDGAVLALTERNKELEDALGKYGWHESKCDHFSGHNCSCGWDDVCSALGEKKDD